MATATHLSYKNRARFRRFVTGVLVGLLAATGVAGAPAFAAGVDDGSVIHNVTWTWATPNSGDTIDGSRLIMKSDSDTTALARLEFYVNAERVGRTQDYAPGELKIEIPYKKWTDRNGNVTGEGVPADDFVIKKSDATGPTNWVYEIDSARGVLIVENGRYVDPTSAHGLLHFRFKVGGRLYDYVNGTISDEYKATITTPNEVETTSALDAKISTTGSTTCNLPHDWNSPIRESVAWDGVFQINERTLTRSVVPKEQGNQNSLWKSPITITPTDSLTQGVVLTNVSVSNWDASTYTATVAPGGRSAIIEWDGTRDASPTVSLTIHYPPSLFEGVNPGEGQVVNVASHMWDVEFTSYLIDDGEDASSHTFSCRDQDLVQRGRGKKPVIYDKDDNYVDPAASAAKETHRDYSLKGSGNDYLAARYLIDRLNEGEDLTGGFRLENHGNFNVGRGFLPVLSVGAATTETVNAGERVEYTATLTNPASDRATRPATVEVPIPDGFSLDVNDVGIKIDGTPFTSGGAIGFTNNVLTVPVPNIEPGEQLTVSIPLVAQADGVKATVGVLNAKQLKHEMGTISNPYNSNTYPTRMDIFTVTNTGNGTTPAGVPFEIDRVAAGGSLSLRSFDIPEALVEYHAYVNDTEVDVLQSTSSPSGYTRNVSLPALKPGDVFKYTITIAQRTYTASNRVAEVSAGYVEDVETWNNADTGKHNLEYRMKLGTKSPLNNPYDPQAHDEPYAVLSDRNMDTISNSWSLYTDDITIEMSDLLQYFTDKNPWGEGVWGYQRQPFDPAHHEYLTSEDVDITTVRFSYLSYVESGERKANSSYIPFTVWGKSSSDDTWTRYADVEIPRYGFPGRYNCAASAVGPNTSLAPGVTVTKSASCSWDVNLPEGVDQIRYTTTQKRIWSYNYGDTYTWGVIVLMKVHHDGPVVQKWLAKKLEEMWIINEASVARYRSSWKSEPEESSGIPAQALEGQWRYRNGHWWPDTTGQGQFYQDHYGRIPSSHHAYWGLDRELQEFSVGSDARFGTKNRSAGIPNYGYGVATPVLNKEKTLFTVTNTMGLRLWTGGHNCVAGIMYDSGEWKKADGVRYYSLQAPGVRVDKKTVKIQNSMDNGGKIHIGGEGTGLSHIVDEDGNVIPIENDGVQLIDNWRGTGRQMLIVTVIYDEQWPHSSDYGTRYSPATSDRNEVHSVLEWTSYYSIEDYTVYGSDITRLEAAEVFVEGDELWKHSAKTGKTQLANVNRDAITDTSVMIGQRDTVPTGIGWNDTQRGWLNNLNLDHDNPVFVYAMVGGTASGTPSLLGDYTKVVRNPEDPVYNDIAWVNPEDEYTYRLKYYNPEDNDVTDLVFYDSLETWVPDGHENDKRFYGTMTSINMHAFTAQGIAPKLYVSTVENLDLDIEANKDLSNTSVWKRVPDEEIDTYDYSGVKAVAIDCSKKTNGDAYVIEPFKLLMAEITMKAPTREEAIGLLSEQEPVRYAYNDTYATGTVMYEDSTTRPAQSRYRHTVVALHRDKLDIEALKVLEGRNLEAGKFHFELVDSTGKVWGTATNRADGTVLFDPIKITAAQAGVETFTLRETGGVDASGNPTGVCPTGYTCDPVEYKLKVKIVELLNPKTGEPSGEVSVFPEYITEFVGDVPTFTNRYAAEGDGQVNALKRVQAARVGVPVPTLAADDFFFTLTPVGGAPGISGGSLRVGNKADGSIDFTGLHYTHEDLDKTTGKATYTYELREDTSAGLCTDSKWQCDGHVETVTMTLRDNGNGTISATASYDGDGAVFVNTYDDLTPTGIRLTDPRGLLVIAVWGVVVYMVARYIRRLRTT